MIKAARQTTLREAVSLSGTGVHCNVPVTMTINPADADSGIVFVRTGVPGGEPKILRVDWSQVTMTELRTVIGEGEHGSVATIEHLMSAFHGLGVDNALVEVDGPEVPIMDGSACRFVEAIDEAGIVFLSARRRYLKVLKRVRIEADRGFAELLPNDSGFRLEVEIDFPHEMIGRQKRCFDLSPDVFRSEICRARTFGFIKDVERLWQAGFALGASLDNTVALEDARILNPEGLRYSDEFVRHKMLDAIGDLALAGAPLMASYHSYCGGHRMNIGVLEALFSDPSAYAFIDVPQSRVRGGHAEMPRAAAAAFAPVTR